MGDGFTVLHVCTGNLCRSPLAEHLMRAGLEARGLAAADFVVRSAGTMGRDGERMEPYAADVLADRGLDSRDFRVRALTSTQVVGADLVLTATRRHRLAVVDLDPTAGQRTFTLREFARLAAHVDPRALAGDSATSRARALVEAAGSHRRPAPRPQDDDLADPYKGPRRGFIACAATIDEALRAPLDLWADGGGGR